jgi:hypothetical protein
MGADWPSRLASDLLSSSVACYDALGAPPCPQRAAVLFGTTPALDCPTLAVVLTSIEAKSGPGTPSNRCTAVPRARLAVWVSRCYPTLRDDGSPPPQREEEEASKLLDSDLGCLWDGLTGAWSEGTLFPSFPGLGCESVTIGTSVAFGPMGGLAAWALPVIVDLVGVR